MLEALLSGERMRVLGTLVVFRHGLSKQKLGDHGNFRGLTWRALTLSTILGSQHVPVSDRKGANSSESNLHCPARNLTILHILRTMEGVLGPGTYGTSCFLIS